MDQELLSFALQSPPSIMLDAADHLLAAGNTQAAALLYQKGGKLGKAVEMAFAAGMMDVLDSITAQLDQDADADLLARYGQLVCLPDCSASIIIQCPTLLSASAFLL
jgi:hypothetical protein